MGEAAVPSAHLPPLSRVEAGSGLQGKGEPRGGVRFLRPRAPQSKALRGRLTWEWHSGPRQRGCVLPGAQDAEERAGPRWQVQQHGLRRPRLLHLASQGLEGRPCPPLCGETLAGVSLHL